MHDYSYIKQRRKELGITQKELGDKVGVSAAYIQQIENNIKQNPSIQILNKILKELKIDTVKKEKEPSYLKLIHNMIETYRSADLDFVNFALETDQGNKPCFKSFEEYQKNISLYWEDVVVWYPIDDFSGYNLNLLEDSEIKEISNFLELSFKLKMSEILERHSKEK